MGRSLFVLCLLTLVGCAKPHWAPAASAHLSKSSVERCAGWFPNSNECFAFAWETLKFGRGTHSSLILKIGRPNAADGTLIVSDTADTIDVIMTMPEMGHGTGPIDVDRVDVGTYRAHGIYLDHGGLYLIRVRRNAGGTPRDEASVRLTL